MPSDQRQFRLDVDELPARWYNIVPDLPEPLPPPKDPEDGPSRMEQLPNMMIGECLKQEFSTDSWIDIPEGLRQLYLQAGRPRPLFRALSLESSRDARQALLQVGVL